MTQCAKQAKELESLQNMLEDGGMGGLLLGLLFGVGMNLERSPIAKAIRKPHFYCDV